MMTNILCNPNNFLVGNENNIKKYHKTQTQGKRKRKDLKNKNHKK